MAAARAGANAARAEVEAARAEAEAARAEAEAARAETIAAKEMARTYVATSTADAIIDEAMAMLEARDAALLQVQARHRIELQSMQLELHSAEQTSDRAACEQEVLRSEVAAAEERERTHIVYRLPRVLVNRGRLRVNAVYLVYLNGAWFQNLFG